MEIQQITRYKLEGKEFDSLPKVKTEIENRIGAIIDKMDATLNSKQRLNILKALVKDKSALAKLLTVTFEIEPKEYGQMKSEVINILDL